MFKLKKNLAILALTISVSTLSLSFSPLAQAHSLDYGAVKTQLTVNESKIELLSVVHKKIHLNKDKPEERQAFMQNYLVESFQILQQSDICPVTLVSFDETPNTAETSIEAFFTCPNPVKSLDDIAIYTVFFNDFFESYDHFVTFLIGDQAYDLLFTIENQNFPGQVTATSKPSSEVEKLSLSSPSDTSSKPADISLSTIWPIGQQFLTLGILHIWAGYDHILFLLVTILLVRKPKKIIALVTSFTLAHSLTLALAGLNIVTLPSTIVEPLIAVSIIFVAVRNMMIISKDDDQVQLSEKWITTFGFGLIHGLGFAGVLGEVGIPNHFFIPALLVFNIGIEVGQLAILAVVVPLLFWVDKKSWRKAFLFGVSGLITAVAVVWLGARL